MLYWYCSGSLREGEFDLAPLYIGMFRDETALVFNESNRDRKVGRHQGRVRFNGVTVEGGHYSEPRTKRTVIRCLGGLPLSCGLQGYESLTNARSRLSMRREFETNWTRTTRFLAYSEHADAKRM